MVLSHIDLKNAIKTKTIVIDPCYDEHFRGASYILHLGRTHIYAKSVDSQIDIRDDVTIKEAFSEKEESDYLILKPNQLALSNTLEKISIPFDLIGFISPLSHICRLGIDTTQSGMYINPGWGFNKSASLTFNICSHNPNELKLPAGTPICHIFFMDLRTPLESSNKFKSVYEEDQAPIIPKLNMDKTLFVNVIDNRPVTDFKQTVKTEVEVNVTQVVKVHLPAIQRDFDELKDILTKKNPELRKDLEEISGRLDDVGPQSEKDNLYKPMNKLHRFLEQLKNRNSKYYKIIKGTKRSVELAQKIAKTYNKIAQWLALPQVPDLLLGEK